MKFNKNTTYVLQWSNFIRIVRLCDDLSIGMSEDNYEWWNSICTAEEVLGVGDWEIIQEWK